MTIYQKNIEAMKSRSNLIDKLQELQSNGFNNAKSIEFHEIETLEENKALAITINGKYYRLNSSYYPAKEAAIWASQFELTDLYNYVPMFGLGNGCFARELIKRLRPENMMLIYEPCAELFIYVINHYDISDILSNSKVTIAVEGINEYDFHATLRDHIDWMTVHYQVLCNHPYFDNIFRESYKAFLSELKDNNNKALINRNTMAFFGEMSVKNSILNLKFLKDANIDLDFKEDFSGLDVPAIIVSAGPSLNKNIDQLKAAKGKAVIFCVDRALDFVLEHGIEPDFIVTLDSSKPVEFFSNKKDIDIPLFCAVDASHAVMETHKGRKIFYGLKGFTNYIYHYFEKEYSRLGTGGCVATAAFSICVGLGFTRIILIGQDLAFSPDHSTHASGIQNDDARIRKVFAVVEGIDGKPVNTRHDWYSYLTWFQDSILEFPQLHVIDATEGGAKIKGTTICTLKEAIESYCKKEVDCKSILEYKKPTFDAQEAKQFYDLIRTAIDNIEEIREGAVKAIECCQKLSREAEKGTIGSEYSQKLVKQISDINETVMKHPVYQFVDSDISVTSTRNLGDIYKLTGDEKQDQITTYKKAEAIYTAIESSAIKIKPMLEDILPGLQ